MPCTKTGCHIFIEPYGEYAWGDAFEIEPVLAGPAQTNAWRALKRQGLDEAVKNTVYFRIVQRSFKPLNGLTDVHYVVHDYDNWFDNGGSHPESHKGVSTLITNNFSKGDLR